MRGEEAGHLRIEIDQRDALHAMGISVIHVRPAHRPRPAPARAVPRAKLPGRDEPALRDSGTRPVKLNCRWEFRNSRRSSFHLVSTMR